MTRTWIVFVWSFALSAALFAVAPSAAQQGGVFRADDQGNAASQPAGADKPKEPGKPADAAPATMPAEAKDLIDEARFAKADVVLRVSTEGRKDFLTTYDKATFKVLEVYKEGKHDIGGMGKLTKDGEFWMAYIVRKTDKPLPAGEMTLYLTYKVEYMQAGMQPPRKSYSTQFLGNSPEAGTSHLKSGQAASEPASQPAGGIIYNEYVVVAGDTLGKIARKVYGNSHDDSVILDANPGLDPRKLVVGQVLKYPVKKKKAPASAPATQESPLPSP